CGGGFQNPRHARAPAGARRQGGPAGGGGWRPGRGHRSRARGRGGEGARLAEGLRQGGGRGARGGHPLAGGRWAGGGGGRWGGGRGEGTAGAAPSTEGVWGASVPRPLPRGRAAGVMLISPVDGSPELDLTRAILPRWVGRRAPGCAPPCTGLPRGSRQTG